MATKKKFKFTTKKVDTSIIEIIDDDDSDCLNKNSNATAATTKAKPTEKSASDRNYLDEYCIGSDVNGISLSSNDLESLDSSLNGQEDYVRAMERLSEDLKKVETKKPLAEFTPLRKEQQSSQPVRSAGKFKFQRPKSSTVSSSSVSTAVSTTSSQSTPLSISKDSSAKTKFQFNYRTIHDDPDFGDR